MDYPHLLAVFLALTVWGFIAYWRSTNECDHNATAPVNPMKTVRYCEYGVVTLAEVEKPVPKDDQVLIKVRAASLNSLDAYMVRDIVAGSLVGRVAQTKKHAPRPRCRRRVEAVGKNVTQFKAGDEVFGICFGRAGRVCRAPRDEPWS